METPAPQTSLSRQQRNQFIAMLAHELRNPIAPIRTGLELLATEALDAPARRKAVAMMRRQLSHMVRLLDDLLDAARVSAGELRLGLEPLALQGVLEAAVESVDAAARANRLQLVLGGPSREALVPADRARLAQAFTNLLHNCVRHAPADSRISIDVEAQGAWVLVSVADQRRSRPTPPPADSFEPLTLLPRAASDAGLGIGLELVKGLIGLHGGQLESLRARPGPGHLFTIKLPRARAAAAANLAPDGAPATPPALAAGARPVQAGWPSHRILVVDDNADAADSLGLLLELDGQSVRIARDGPSAIAETHDFQPEFILMDIGLPGMNGIEATRHIRAAPPAHRPTIVALTGWGSDADRQAAAAAGCDFHLVKPVDYDALRQALASLERSARFAAGA